MRCLLIFDGHKTIEIKKYENNALSTASVSFDRKLTIYKVFAPKISTKYLKYIELCLKAYLPSNRISQRKTRDIWTEQTFIIKKRKTIKSHQGI